MLAVTKSGVAAFRFSRPRSCPVTAGADRPRDAMRGDQARCLISHG